MIVRGEFCMKVKNQIVCCLIIGCMAWACENCGSENIHNSYESLKNIVFKEYGFCDMKENCQIVWREAKKLPEKMKNAEDYIYEIMAAE